MNARLSASVKADARKEAPADPAREQSRNIEKRGIVC